MKDKDILIDLTLVDQFRDTEDESWKNRSCGVCVTKMMMVFKKPDLSSVSVMSLINKAVNSGGYIENVGWRHQSLVSLASEYGVSLQFKKEFFKTSEDKARGTEVIIKEIREGKIVAVSIHKDFNVNKSSHLVVVRGIREEQKILGFYIQDPDPRDRGNNYFVSMAEFLTGWRGGMIWFLEE